MLRRLAAFADSFTLEAAEAVLAGVSRDVGETIPTSLSVLAGVAALVDRSVLQPIESTTGEPRFGMLSMIRDFGLEQLVAIGELGPARRAHERWYHDLAEEASLRLRTRIRQETLLDRLDAERGNFRLLLYCCEDHGDSFEMLKLAGALAWFWYIRGPIGAGRAWLERALAASSDAPLNEHRVRALVGAGLLAHFQGDDEHAVPWLEAALVESPESGDPWWRAFALLLLGMVSEDRGDYDLAEPRFLEALPLFEAVGDASNTAFVTTHLGIIAWGRGDHARALATCEQAMVQQRALQDRWGLAVSLGYLGLIATDAGEYPRAAAAFRESIQLRWEDGVPQDVGASFTDLAALAGMIDQPEQAARLYGAAAAIREEHERLPLNLPERLVFERGETKARVALGELAWKTAYAEGRACSLDEAYAEAIAFAESVAGTNADR
jgi:non-specific serine/threonine protein kinase